jgi:hypothetical protein
VLDRLQAHAEAQGEASFLPLFLFEPTADFRGMIGEDVHFFRKCRAAGLEVWCDHGLSWEVGHVAKQVLTNAHAVRQQARWRERTDRLSARYAARIEQIEGIEGPGGVAGQ